MTITNLPSYPQQYLPQYHLGAPPSPAHTHPHAHVHPAHPHAHPSHHQHQAYTHAAHSQHLHHPAHVLAGPVRSEPVTRKRPKYTRSKTGCLTCRVKKIKCDESKPTCTRCAHGQRECTWPENVPSRKKPATKKPSDQSSDKMSPESASPSSSSGPATAREWSPSRKSPLDTLSVSDGAVSGRHPKSEPNTAAASPTLSPLHSPASVVSRRPSLSHNVQSSYSSSNSQQLRQQYPTLTAPNVSQNSFHSRPPSSHGYQSFNPSSGPHHAISRHDHPSIQTTQSRLADLGVNTTHHGMGQWHPSPMMSPSVDHIEPFFRTVQERNMVSRSSASYAS